MTAVLVETTENLRTALDYAKKELSEAQANFQKAAAHRDDCESAVQRLEAALDGIDPDRHLVKEMAMPKDYDISPSRGGYR